MNLINKSKTIELLEKTVTIFFPKESHITSKGLNTLEVTFSREKYPALGVNLECFENPKLNSTDEIKNFLSDNLIINNSVIRKEDFFKLNYEVKVDNEKLVIWKVLHYLKPRSFRLLRFSLTWPDNEEAEKVVSPILKKIPRIIESAKFNFSRTLYDDLASLEYKLISSKYKNQNFWNIFKLKLPIKWFIEYSDDSNFAKIYMDSKKNFNCLIEKFDINLNNSLGNNDKAVEKLIQEITKEVSISESKLKKSENNNYLFYFLASEKELKDSNKIIQNKIWYRIKVLENKIVIIGAVFELSSKIDLENKLYLEKLDQIIGASEILV